MRQVELRSLSGRSALLSVKPAVRLEDVKPMVCDAFGILPTFCLRIIDQTRGETFGEPDSTPFRNGGMSFQAIFSWDSCYDASLRNLPALKQEPEFQERSNPPESALSGGGYTTPQMRATWHRSGGLRLDELVKFVEKACRHAPESGPWHRALRRALRVSPDRVSLASLRTLSIVAQGRPGIGADAEGAVLALRTYMRCHDIDSKPRVRRMRCKTTLLSLKARLAAYKVREQ